MIKWARVAELREEIGEEDFDEVVDLFLEEVQEVVTKLRTNPSLADLEQDLHFLKGSALSLGFARFSELCQNGEQRSASGDAASVDLAEILTGFEQSKKVFLAELQDQMANT
ncbi:Hpt domain-containing protein [Thalassococcus sp. S3]|uniref:Hpt domain-containing protein n=1 Tax=Thalassococcus sp. S3 TaxID=2017482 RepID=UPI0010245042|nr:Hpt domain-containing protein [Thalassococcus sp. S3]QBF34124.1 histidine kinase [Thalassococcus sp. S3]